MTLIPASLREPVVAFGLEDTQEEHYGAPILPPANIIDLLAIHS